VVEETALTFVESDEVNPVVLKTDLDEVEGRARVVACVLRLPAREPIWLMEVRIVLRALRLFRSWETAVFWSVSIDEMIWESVWTPKREKIELSDNGSRDAFPVTAIIGSVLIGY
jgi:hypothetical protein